MRESLAAAIVSFLLALAPAALRAQAPAPLERVGPHFRIVLHPSRPTRSRPSKRRGRRCSDCCR
jgi:hypothetical protein